MDRRGFRWCQHSSTSDNAPGLPGTGGFLSASDNGRAVPRPTLPAAPGRTRIAALSTGAAAETIAEPILAERAPEPIPPQIWYMRTQIARLGTASPSSAMAQPKVPTGAQSLPPQEGSVAVVLRVRPPVPEERAEPLVLRVQNQHMVLLSPEGPGGARSTARRRKTLKFVFDHVFDEEATQEEVFQHTTLPLLDSLLDGYNCSVFAYGASGAGKTHTVMGSKASPGMVQLATVELFKRLEAMKDKSYEVLVSYQQVYKERVYDLLVPQGPLNIREEPGKGAVAQGLSFHQPTSPEQLLDMLAKGNKNRAQRHTKANATSSRSHAIFQIQVKQWDLAGGLAGAPYVSKLSFIDLAGSERVGDSQDGGEGLLEGTSINRSLLAFKSVVRALTAAKGGQNYVPFRDSKLTRLLKDSLGGNCRSAVIAAVSPAASAGLDTCSTLRFASRARHILLPPVQPQRPAMPTGSPKAASLPDVQLQPRTPNSPPQELSGHQEMSLCPDAMTAKMEEEEEEEVLALEESVGLEEATGLEESTWLEEAMEPDEAAGLEDTAAPSSPAEPSEAGPAPGMQLSCVAKVPVTMPEPLVPSADPGCSQDSPELSPCSSPRPMSPGPVKRMPEPSNDSQSENSRSSQTRRKHQQGRGKAAETSQAAQSPVQSPAVSLGPRCATPQPTPAPGAAPTPSPLPGPAPELRPPSAEQWAKLRAAALLLASSPPPRAQTPNGSSSFLFGSSCSTPSILLCPPVLPCPPLPPFPWFQLRHRPCVPSVGSALFVCLQVMGGFRK
ncbi:kinesin-like protein KIF18B [Malurus melanocephalus]|uniref:kinesin-like protein KIF18B n=1 Tax=Malurus melanocephalus TaxID=175006 RepID=UPI0025496FA2|nr:kinesin-like protein KIF18B [Malurus melanocephalus]